ncbi:pantoate--beta-alanine ligase [Parafilimonas sp.]|uniref:pantoate--beta-alanine ligase n=1 Tax=Parafilimonas sp. TaxID=1969739 RepID=UPI003F7D8191
MILFKTIRPLQTKLEKLRNNKLKIGFVPTMGALHAGHLALMKEAKKQCDIVVCSIFVNPTQFNDKSDFDKYPVTIEQDIFLLETNKTDILFLPSLNEIYPQGTQHLQHFELGYLENILEGKYRPGHFQGVCNVVHRLLNIVHPDILFLGRKDYQQYLVVKKMMQDFYPSINIKAVDTARETSGLAMSSRNMRLSTNAHSKATVIYQSLQFIQQHITERDVDWLKERAKEKILQGGFDKIDYVEICDAETLLPVTVAGPGKKFIALAAAFIEDVRLIDNILL